MSSVNFSPPQGNLYAEEEHVECDFGEFSSATPVVTEPALYRLPAAKNDDRIPRFRRLQSCDYVVAVSNRDFGRQKSLQQTLNNEMAISNARDSTTKCANCIDPDPHSSCGNRSNDVEASCTDVSQTLVVRCNKRSEVDVNLGESEFDAKVSYLSCEQSESHNFPEVKDSRYYSNGISVSSGFPVQELDEKHTIALHNDFCFPHQDSNILSADVHDKLGFTEESCEYDEFQSVLPTSEGCDERASVTTHHNSDWASFDNFDVSSVSDDSWLAFQNDDVKNEDCKETTISSCHKRMAKLESAVGDLFAQTFPQHICSFPDDKKTPEAVTDSCSLSFDTPLLLDVIGEDSLLLSSKELNHSSEVLSSPCTSLSSTSTWNSLKVMQDTDALKFQWDGSRGKKLLLKALSLESPTRLSSRRVKKPSVVRINQDVSDATKLSCRQPYDSSFSQKVLSVSHLRM